MFEKTKKLKSGSPFNTLIDRAEEKISKIFEKYDEANVRAREKLEAAAAERDRLTGEINRRQERVSALSKEYREVFGELKAKNEEMIRERSVTEDDLKEGRVNVREFFIAGTRREEIEAEARAAAEEKAGPIRETIRAIRREIVELDLKRAAEQLKISQASQSVAEELYLSLEYVKKTLDESGIRGMRIEAAHETLKEAKNESGLIKGGILFHPKSWRELRSIEEIEDLALDPVIKAEHFPNLRKLIGEIRGLDFLWVTVNYSPSENLGRAAGEFWCSIRPRELGEMVRR